MRRRRRPQSVFYPERAARRTTPAESGIAIIAAATSITTAPNGHLTPVGPVMMPRFSERQRRLLALALLLMATFELWSAASLRHQHPWLAAADAAFACAVIAGIILAW